MTVFFFTTPNPSFQKEGTTGRHPAVGADLRVCPNKKGSLREI